MIIKFLAILLIAVLIGVYWRWWLPGPKVANDFPIITEGMLKSGMNLPFVWFENGAEGIGEHVTFFLWGWPLSFIAGTFASLGLSFAFIEKFIILVPILFIGGFGIWMFASSINLSNSARFITTIFYLTNTYILLLIDGGQLAIALALSWFPISFLTIQTSIQGGVKKKILAGITTAILGFFDFRFIYVLILLSLIKFLYHLLLVERKKIFFLFEWTRSGIVIMIVVLGLHAYWLFPLFKAPISTNTYQFFTQTSFLSFVNLGNSMLTLAPHWFVNVFGKITPLHFEFIFIPVLVFLAPILRPKNYEIGFWILVAVISIFLAKGTSEPLPQVYQWLFNYLPGFSLFRDSTKFFFLVLLSYSLLLGVTVDEILKRLRDLKSIKIIILVTLTGYFLFLIRPAWSGRMTGTFSSTPFQEEYFKLGNLLENDENFSRVFWIPSLPSLGYSSLNHPRVEAARLVQRRPFAIGTEGTYELFNFLREAPYMGEIFDVAGIGYLVYPYLDSRREDMHPDNIEYYYTFSDQLSKRSWLTKMEESPIPLFKVREYQDRFFITPNVWWVIGSDNLLNEATKSAKLKLSKNALIFAEEYPGLTKRLNELPNAKIVLNNKTEIDLAANFISPTNLIFPSKNLNFDPDKSGWWKREATDLISWRSFLQGKYNIDNQDFDLGGGWAVGEGNVVLNVKDLPRGIELKKDKILLARVLESTRSGVLDFYQDDQLIGKTFTKKEGNNIRWFEIGEFATDNGELKVVSSGGINVINALAVLDKNEWASFLDKAKNLRKRITTFDEANSNNGDNYEISYQKINPTKYIVSVSNSDKDSFLVFSQSYHDSWKISGQNPLPVYSLLNGFYLGKDGQYVVEFEAQKYVLPGLIISGLTLASLILIKFSKRS